MDSLVFFGLEEETFSHVWTGLEHLFGTIWNISLNTHLMITNIIKRFIPLESYDSFYQYIEQQLMELLNEHADKHSLLINDSIKYSKTFRWAFRNEDLHPAALLLLKSYVSHDLVGIFRAHFNSIKTVKRFILPFLHTCSITFKTVIWKLRNEKWKALRDQLGLTKQSFKDYRKNLKTNRNNNNEVVPSDFILNPRRYREFGYINPFNNNFRNFKLEKDFLFILFTSSNFLHSGPFFSHLECTEFIDYSSSACVLNYAIYNV
ncbi:hypothetical protein RhiirA4_478427 [Rhizophagus irregularis]|uniref:Uncharacterized protein n=1 Tax=Rhizophagus irregularis TaxID=588596 RepID=A0A2I1HEY5_9GLOM|nr:hypothetical protein RhiirA4_478427 [Rhizophagus irregularis]